MVEEFHDFENVPELHKSFYLIEAIWIIDRGSGVCLFDKYYKDQGDSGISSDLICGFFSAFVDISEEFFAEQVDYIKFRDSRLYFTYVENIIFILKFEEDLLLEEEMEEILFEIAVEFMKEFQENLAEWNGNLCTFEDFNRILDQIVAIHPIYVYFN